ncbi:hypothetical protein ABBQ38_013094 [Trebouxia sp. C0009 RCD-2024]
MGLTLSYALQITTLTSMTVRLASVAENAFNAVERIAEYSRLKEEAPAVIENSAPADWPSAGKIEFKGVKMRYRPGLPLVLKGLDVSIEAGTTCGVVGRTGAGKTSVINTIFRLMELDQGAINIDGLDIAKLGLAQLRNSMAIIPQEYAVILKFPVFPEFLAVSSDYMQLLAAFNFGPRMALAADVYVNFLRPCL